MINSASKCLKITLKVIKFSKPEKKFPQKNQVESFEGDFPPPSPLWQKPCIMWQVTNSMILLIVSVPLVSRILPSDICRIHKKGSSIR
jgi:hypothetical protein